MTEKYIKEIVKDTWRNIWNKQSTEPNEIKKEMTRSWRNPQHQTEGRNGTKRTTRRRTHARITRGFVMASEDPYVKPVEIDFNRIYVDLDSALGT